MYRSLIEQIRLVVDEEAKKLLPWKRPSPEALKANEKKLRSMGMTGTTKKKLIARGPFGPVEAPIRTGNPHGS